FGEGRYEETERAIQQLLGVDDALVEVEGDGAEAPADWDDLESAETYLGYDRAERFASPGGLAPDERRTYAIPAHLGRNQWALAGDWTIRDYPALLNTAGGRIAFRFHARDLHLVMGPAAPANSVRFRVRIDGQAPGPAHGTDIDPQGNGAV